MDGCISKNLENASKFVLNAIADGAQIIVFPEFMPQGYRLTKEIWSAAEEFDGPTTRWLSETSKRYRVYIGTSFLEVKGKHLFNTF